MLALRKAPSADGRPATPVTSKDAAIMSVAIARNL
jgi:hypothetical protein